MNKKVVLAFSGGLDTSFCVPFLKEKGYQVVALTVDTGGFTPLDVAKIKKRAKKLRVVKHYFIDGKDELYQRFISYLIKGNVLKGGVYPICVAPERVIQAEKLINIAKKEKAQAVAHGSTGAGNDQVRFDFVIHGLAPEIKLMAPIRGLGITRQEEIKYLKNHGLEVDTETKNYSVNKGIIGTTIGGRETKESWQQVPDEAYPTVVPVDKAPAKGEKIIISFNKGFPVKINGKNATGVKIMLHLNQLGAKHAVGKGTHLGNTILGIKGRVAFEAPAMHILISAHKELEKLTQTSKQLFWKDILSQVYGNLLHQGLYFDPVARDIEQFIDSSQKMVTGDVKVKLHKGNIVVLGIKSPYSMMKKKIATYGEENSLWTGQEAAGFCKLYGLESLLHKSKTRFNLVDHCYED